MKRAVAGIDPQHCRSEPDARQGTERGGDSLEVESGRKNSALSDQPVYLEREGVKRREEDQPERAEEEPARPQVALGLSLVSCRTQKNEIPLTAFRCPSCGYVELYAPLPEPG